MHPTLRDVYFFVEHNGGDAMDIPPDSADLVRVDHGETTVTEIDSTARALVCRKGQGLAVVHAPFGQHHELRRRGNLGPPPRHPLLGWRR